MSDGDNPLLHTKIDLAQGGAIGVKDMLIDGVKRLAVRTPDGGPLGSAYLHFDECVQVAHALFGNRAKTETVGVVITIPYAVWHWIAESYPTEEPEDVIKAWTIEAYNEDTESDLPVG